MKKNKHATFGSPSQLYRYKECPGSVAYTKDMPDVLPSPYAEWGTRFHKLMEKCFPFYLLQQEVKIENILKNEEQEMIECVMSTLALVQEKWHSFCAKHTDSQYKLELPVKLTKDIFGTADVVFYGTNKKTQKTDVLTIDYKTGQGTFVSAQENLQGLTYLLGAIKTLKINPASIGVVMIIIAQVRHDDGWTEYVVKTEEERTIWETTIGVIVDKVKAIYKGKLPILDNLHAGSWCKFCKADGKCIAQKEAVNKELQLVAKELPIEELVRTLTLDEQVGVFLKKSQIEDFLNSIAKNLTSAFEMGTTHPALKLIRTNGRRGWRDDMGIEDMAGKLIERGFPDPYKKALIGLTEVERKIGKGKIDDLTKASTGKLELVKSDDKRDAVQISQIKELPE